VKIPESSSDRIIQLAKELRLPVLARYKEYVTTGVSLEEGLSALLEKEAEEREERGIQRRIKQAGFPFIKTLDTFEPTRLPNLKKEQIYELATGEFIKEGCNCVAFGNPGTGKTHLAIALGIEVIRRGYSVRFKRASDLVMQMMEAQETKQLSQYLKALNKCDLLIIDEMGYLSFSAEGASLLFGVFGGRYERQSTMVTTNLEFSKWTQFLGDPMLSAALVDRLAHKTIFLNMNGPSYRYHHA